MQKQHLILKKQWVIHKCNNQFIMREFILRVEISHLMFFKRFTVAYSQMLSYLIKVCLKERKKKNFPRKKNIFQ